MKQKTKPYNVKHLKELISQEIGTEEMGKILGVSGRSVRNWLRKEGLETKVKNKGWENLCDPDLQRKAIAASKATWAKKATKKIECICEQCRNKYMVKKSVAEKVGTRFCSRRCMYDFHLRGAPENHPRWKGGITEKNQRLRGSKKYAEWRISVWKRDMFECQCCGKVGNDLRAHHLNCWKSYETQRFEIDNGVTMCKRCHKHLHSMKGRTVVRKDLIDFINEVWTF